jgi:hypothetical protein
MRVRVPVALVDQTEQELVLVAVQQVLEMQDLVELVALVHRLVLLEQKSGQE